MQLSYNVVDRKSVGAECLSFDKAGGYLIMQQIQTLRCQTFILQQHDYLILQRIQTQQVPNICPSTAWLSYNAVDTNPAGTEHLSFDNAAIL